MFFVRPSLTSRHQNFLIPIASRTCNKFPTSGRPPRLAGRCPTTTAHSTHPPLLSSPQRISDGVRFTQLWVDRSHLLRHGGVFDPPSTVTMPIPPVLLVVTSIILCMTSALLPSLSYPRPRWLLVVLRPHVDPFATVPDPERSNPRLPPRGAYARF